MKIPQLDFFLNLVSFRKEQPKKSLPHSQEKQLAPFETEIHYAPRLRKGWKAEYHPGGVLKLTLPGYMREPSFAVVRQDIQRWAAFARKRKTPAIKAELKLLELQIWERCEVLLKETGKSIVTRGDRLPPIRTKGRVHDLKPHFETVNQKYFGGIIRCSITWSARAGGLSFHSRRKDPKTGEDLELISISRGYDFENCPDWALQGIIYHECLHIAVPPIKTKSKRIVHGREFHAQEKKFSHYKEWKEWHGKILPANVRRLKSKNYFPL